MKEFPYACLKFITVLLSDYLILNPPKISQQLKSTEHTLINSNEMTKKDMQARSTVSIENNP